MKRITMRYGENGIVKASTLGAITTVLGSASANGTVTLSDNLSRYQFVCIATYFSDQYGSFDVIPVAFFKSPAMPIHIRYDANGTYRHIQVAYASDTSVTISNRSNLNVQILGIKLGGQSV